VARTGISAAINARLTPQVSYDIDPRGWRMFTAVAAVVHRGMNGGNGGVTVNPQATFTGYAVSPQRMTGAASLGNATVVVPAHSTLGQEKSTSTITDPALRIFAERLARRSS
jgi:hypothetical protein